MTPTQSPNGTGLRVCLYRSRGDARVPHALAALPPGLPVSVAASAAADLDDPRCSRFEVAEGDSAAACLAAAARQWPDADWLLVDAAARLPADWWPRLAAAIAAAADGVLSPLCDDREALDPRPQAGVEVDWDGLLWLYAEPRLLPVATWSRSLSFWPAAAARGLDAGHDALPVGCAGRALARLFVGAGGSATAGEPCHAVVRLRERLAGCARTPATPVGRDGRPVLLHVLHGWGGGAERFVRDLAGHDSHFRHLVLRADNDPDRGQPGRSLSLYHELDAPPLRHWPLQLPITATALGHGEYAQLLAELRAAFPVASVLVSSLIGHALDLLDLDLPITVVCHDYYPMWPLLHADFGDAGSDFSASAIADALAATPTGAAFGERRPAWWQALRKRWVEGLLRARARMIAPSRSVRDNLLRIEPKLRALDWTCIPHGLAGWPQRPAWTPDPHRLRLLVPGRISDGKGARLLRAVLPRLPADVELVLLGAGAAGMEFFGQRGVHVLLDYRREELPQRIAELRPRAALLLSSVAETFSYALSEMQSLGVPVVATRRGSFVERIRDGEDGLLVEADADAVLALIDSLRGGRTLPPPTFDADAASLGRMCAAYAQALAAAPATSTRVVAVDLQATQRDVAEHERSQLADHLGERRRAYAAMHDEAARRGEWARSEARLAEERLQWAINLKQELDDTRQHWQLADRQREEALALQHAAERARALAEIAHAESIAAARDQAAELAAQLAERQRWIEALIRQRDEFERERNAILASSSWKLTAPLRVGRRMFARALARLRFQWKRLLSLRQRGIRSLQQRGLRGTLRRLRQALMAAPAAAPTALQVPAATARPSIEGIAFAPAAAPLASIVVPAYNHLDHTLTCLRSLSDHGARVPFEVIVVDDCGSDATATMLPDVPGLVFHRNERNLGFIGACNAGAALARGEFVVFLNNDTAVQAGWLDALLDTFAQHDAVGLVGAKLVYPDGRLQEAGGIVFADGSGWNYGRFDDPAAPQYNYVREVDYCSGAAIALRKSLFERFGGFDPLYAPAYYEDTDLAMKVRAAGLRVLYQPASVVVHFEGISSGTDTSSGTKRFQVINQGKFRERWGDVLAGHAAPGTEIAIAREHRCRHRVLVIDATTPQPDQDSGSVRLVNLLRLLREEGAAVSFFADNRAWMERYTAQLQQHGIEVLWHPYLSDPVRWIEEEAARFDTIVVSRHYILCNYLDLFRRHAPKARLVFDTVDLHYLREQRAAELAGRDDLRRSAEQTRQTELDLIRRVDVTLVVSPVEQELLSREAPGARVDVLSNVHEVFGCRRPFGERRDLMFVGGFQHPPNVDAVTWFVEAVFPLIRAQAPDIEFHVIGSKAPDDLYALNERPGVRFHGFVADIEPFLDGCRLAVAPLRYGAGVKGKVNMSMSYGQPVVATPMAIEGMWLAAGRDVLVGADAAGFAAEVLRAYHDEALWNTLSRNGLANVEAHFSFAAAKRAVARLLAR